MLLENRKKKNLKWPKNTRYKDNVAYHSRLKRKSRERYQNDIDYRNATLDRAKKRYYEDEKYKADTIRRAKERYRRLKTEKLIVSQLSKHFMQGGYFRFPNNKLREIKSRDYKKGYEVRLTVKDKNELLEVNILLNKAGFKAGKSFKKNNKYVQPIYGKGAVEKFQSFLKKRI